MHPKSLVYPSQRPHQSSHVALDVRSNRSVGKIFPFTRDHNLNMALKERSRSLHHLPLEYRGKMAWPHDVKKLTKSIKHIKSLESLRINLNWLPYEQKSIMKVFRSIKHIKNLKEIQLDVIQAFTVHLGKKICPLYKAIKEIRRSSKIEIKLSFLLQSENDNNDFKALLKSFSQIRRLTSVDLTFLNYESLSIITGYIDALHASRSLLNLSIGLSFFKVADDTRFDDLLVSIGCFKKLKNSRLSLQKCDKLSYSKLKPLVPTINVLGHFLNFNLVFDNCSNAMSPFEWRSFDKSIKSLKTPHAVRTKYVGNHRKVALMIIITLIIVCLICLCPLIALAI